MVYKRMFIAILLIYFLYMLGGEMVGSHSENETTFNSNPPTQAPANWSVRMADSVMQRHPVLADRWGYEYGVMLSGIAAVWEKTGEAKYFEYIQRNVDLFVNADGTIRTYRVDEYNIDQVKAGTILFFLYRQTGDEKYLKAAYLLREQLKTHPRTREGGFWHKAIYPHQMWLDGIYMGSPFYAEFAQVAGQPESFEDIANQIVIIEKYTKDPKTGLLYHGWDESKSQQWADPETGCSPHFWGRAMGWYVMALVDVLDHFPEGHPRRGELIHILNETITALIKVQDESGAWFQVLDQGDRVGNYLEASASCMIVYAMAKGMRRGYLSKTIQPAVAKGYSGIIQHFIKVDDHGSVNLTKICRVAGLGRTAPTNPYRDGSFEYYIGEPIVMNDYKGVGPFILASLEVER